MPPAINRPPPPSRVSVATEFVQSYISPAVCMEAAKGVYKHLAGDSLARKETAELRRLRIEKFQEENRHQARVMGEEDELRQLNIARQMNELEYRGTEAEFYQLKIQQLQHPNEEHIEVRRQKLQLLQAVQEEESQLRQLKIESLRAEKENAEFQELRKKLFERQLKDYDEKAKSRKRAQEALETYRERKLRYLIRQTREPGKRKFNDVEGSVPNDESSTLKRIKTRDNRRGPDPESSDNLEGDTLIDALV